MQMSLVCLPGAGIGFMAAGCGYSEEGGFMSSWEDYRNTGKGFALEMARVPGEMCIIFGLLSVNPLLLAAGIAEVAICFKADGKAYDAFMEKREANEAPGPVSKAAAKAFAPGNAASVMEPSSEPEQQAP